MYMHTSLGGGEAEANLGQLIYGEFGDTAERIKPQQVYKYYKSSVVFCSAPLAVAHFDGSEESLEQLAIMKRGSEIARERNLGQAICRLPSDYDMATYPEVFQPEAVSLILGTDSYTAEKLLQFGYESLGRTVELIEKPEEATPVAVLPPIGGFAVAAAGQ